ncbi:BTAD domain-containing putative transcriptional regulator [Nonomuraea sp. NPDC050451]|uniref:AfsR/SARP family transcriptional regulator n=1 Tax=Nonomuraea sp. NPDC050451 TaxID=3364364 RepID=UPI00378D05B7
MQRLTVKVLGPLEVAVGERPVRLTRSRLRTLLVALAMSAGKTVSMDRLAEMVWSDEFPANSRRTLQNYVGGLRSALGSRWIETRPNGFLLRAVADDVDALRFVRLAEQAARAGDADLERDLLDEAMALSRGEPFEDVPSRWLREAEAPHLAERCLAALERRVDLDDATGPNSNVLAELSKWAPRYPLRESLWLRLLKVLDRHGRRAEALQRYEELRSRLGQDLGIDPGPELQQLYAYLLTDHPAPPSPRRLPTQHRSLTGRSPEMPSSTGRSSEMPSFTGRSSGMASSSDRLTDVRVTRPTGPTGGVGPFGLTSPTGLTAPDTPSQPRGRPHRPLRGGQADPRAEAIEPGALLRSWRERASLTQEILAEYTGLSVRTISRLETDAAAKPSLATLRLLAEALALDDDEQAMLSRALCGNTASIRPARGRSGSVLSRITVPRQLPRNVSDFCGRAHDVSAMVKLGEADRATIITVEGMAGIGKTALAIRAAHRLAARFPDGQLFVNLHGHTPGRSFVHPPEALHRMLCALGVPADRVPPHVDDQVGLYRSLLADRKILIVLDDALSETQVLPLLPGSPHCHVLVTSRRRLSGLDGTHTLSLDVLPPTDGVAIFSRAVGQERVAGTPPQVLVDMVRRCGLLPLAIRLTAARLRSHPRWTVDRLLTRLAAPQQRLAELAAGERSVATALEMSYRRLPEEQRRAYRLLGARAPVEFAVQEAAALLNTSAATAEWALERLLDGHLLREPTPGLYRFHDLVRDHAACVMAREGCAAGRTVAAPGDGVTVAQRPVYAQSSSAPTA